MYHLGIDLGSTLTKMALVEPETAIDAQFPVLSYHYRTHQDPNYWSAQLDKFLKEEAIGLDQIERISFTGTHSDVIKVTQYQGIPVQLVDEISAIGRGGLYVSHSAHALVVNMGTGTTFVVAKGKECRHIAGTGVGGGTLSGLGQCLLGPLSTKEIVALAAQGDLEQVDLLMKDVTQNEYPNLPPDLTASNFGKMAHPHYHITPSQASVAAGLVNMILQIIGSMAVMICKSEPVDRVVCVGTLTRTPQIHAVYEMFSKVYGIQFIVPTFAMFSTALGSALVSANVV